MNQLFSNHQFKELVRSVRGCKTAKEERTLVARECAHIRNVFKEENSSERSFAMTKLLYFYILGYPAHFGQMECLKLISSNKFCDKRIGYLGCMLLLDENSDIHLLITNCLKKDLNSTHVHVQSLALCTLASICSSDMAKNLYPFVLRLLERGVVYVSKKAALCACRMISKSPDLIDVFIHHVKLMITSRFHVACLAGCTLALTIIETDQTRFNDIYQLQIHEHLYKTLKNLVIHGSTDENKVRGVSNPFLQVKILRLFSYYGQNNVELPPEFSELLAQVMHSNEKSFLTSKAIMYEAACTIFKMSTFNELRIMAINIMGQFLKSNDKNIIYVALTLMLQISKTDSTAVLRHREEIFQHIFDRDTSISKTAIELIFTLINSGNIVDSIERLTQILYTTTESSKRYITSNIITTLEKFRSSDKWHFLTFIQLLDTASQYMRDDAVSNFVAMVSNTPNVQGLVVEKLIKSVKIEQNQPVLNSVACWCIGEYGHLVVSQHDDTLIKEMISLLENMLSSTLTDPFSKNYAIFSLMKLSSRFSSQLSSIKNIIFQYKIHNDVELQQRASEWGQIYQNYPNLNSKLFESMPPLELNLHNQEMMLDSSNQKDNSSNTIPEIKAQPSPNTDLLMDLMSLDFDKSTQNSIPITEIKPKGKYILNFYKYHSVDAALTFDDPLTDGTLKISIVIINKGTDIIHDLVCQVAVPKTMSVVLLPPSTNKLLPQTNCQFYQDVVVSNPQKVVIKLKIKLNCIVGELHIDENILVDGFPVFNC